MTEKDRRRLEHLFKMLGSANVNEREAAHQKIDELLAKHRKTWNDLFELFQGGGTTADQWNAAYDDDCSAEQAAGDAINAGLPEAAVKAPNALELVQFIVQEFLDITEHESIAIALWILLTYRYQRFTISPRLAFTSPVNGCGKTTALTLLEKLTFRPQRMDNVTPAAIYYLIDRLHGTLLIDEADNLGLGENGTLRAVFNSGHRRGGGIRRVIKSEPREFTTFAPLAIAAIGGLPMPLTRRAIMIEMQKTARTDLKRFDASVAAATRRVDDVYHFVQRWAREKVEINFDPELPKQLRNRVADNWRPLIAIADSFSDAWGLKARAAAVSFAGVQGEEDTAIVLLSDIREVFNKTGADRMAGVNLVAELVNLDDGAPWSEYRGENGDQVPRRLTQGEMVRLLRRFGIRSRSIWPLGDERRRGTGSRKGFHRHQFETAWERYCSAAGTTAQSTEISLIARG
jgi:Protein of unknown function (DUF3631)